MAGWLTMLALSRHGGALSASPRLVWGPLLRSGPWAANAGRVWGQGASPRSPCRTTVGAQRDGGARRPWGLLGGDTRRPERIPLGHASPRIHSKVVPSEGIKCPFNIKSRCFWDVSSVWLG